MHPNGEPFLLGAEKPTGIVHIPNARVVAESTHRTIYISGTAAISPDGVYEGVTENPDGSFTIDAAKQTAAILQRLDVIIRGASNGKATIHNIIDSTVYVLDMKTQYAGMNEEWNKIWPDRLSAPARATVGVKELPDPRFGVEVKATAVFEL